MGPICRGRHPPSAAPAQDVSSINDTINVPETFPPDMGSQGRAKPTRLQGAVLGSEAWPVLIACLAGAAIALGGFVPMNNLNHYLYIQALPAFVVLSPACLTALLAIWAVCRGRPAKDLVMLVRIPPPAALSLMLVLIGATLSLLESARPGYSASLLVCGLLAPALVFLAVRSGRLPAAPLAGAFVAVLVVLLLRADLVFLKEHGFPTSQALYQAKFQTHPYDFHYYTLGNPDHTAGFLILPLALCLFWATDRLTRLSTRVWLLFAAGVILATIALLYVRFADLAALVLVLAALLRSRWPRRVRWGLVTAAMGAAAVIAVRSPGHYLLHVFSVSGESSGAVRASSLGSGWHALWDHPLTGVGLGRFGVGGAAPAHSAVVQAGSEMGVLGLLGLALMTALLVATAVRRLHTRTSGGLALAALVGAASQVIFMAVTGDAAEGLMEGYVSIYGLSLALAAGIGLREPAAIGGDPSLRVRQAIAAVSGGLMRRVRARQAGVRAGIAWLAYGCAWAAVGAWRFNGRVPAGALLSSSRETEYAQVIAAHRAGFGPLVAQIGPHSFLPAAITDDPGGYLYAPWLADLFHTSSIDTIVRLLHVGAMSALASIYLYLIWRLTRSRLAALCAPILVIFASHVLDGGGFYWIPAWTIALTLPWLWIVIRERSAILINVTLIGALAGVTSTFRSGTGLGPLAAAIVVAVIASSGWRRRSAGIVLAILAYVALSTGVLAIAYQARAARMASYPLNIAGQGGITKWSDPAGHPFWHTAYIGLGVIPNRYGITYDDRVAAAYVHRVDPAAPYVSPQYEAILRKRVIHIAETDPGFVANAVVHKVANEMKDGFSNYLALIFLLPVALFAGAGRGRRRRYAAALAPIALIAFSPALLAIPAIEYELPWLGLLACLTIISSCWLVASTTRVLAQAAARPAIAPALAPLASALESLRSPINAAMQRLSGLLRTASRTAVRPIVRISLFVAAAWHATAHAARAAYTDLSGPTRQAGLNLLRSPAMYVAVAMIAGGLAGRHYLSDVRRAESFAPLTGAPVESLRTHLPPVVKQWTATSLLAKWITNSHVHIAEDKGTLAATTNSGYDAYQLQSPTSRLPAGKYMAVVTGQILSGGLQLGLLDVTADKWIKTAIFTSSEEPHAVTMPMAFSLTSPTVVQMILANATNGNHVSHWLLRTVSIRSWNASLRPKAPAATARAPRQLHRGAILTSSASTRRPLTRPSSTRPALTTPQFRRASGPLTSVP